MEQWYRGPGGSAGCYMVLDGHRGAGAAEYVRDRLPGRVKMALLAGEWSNGGAGGDGVAAILEREVVVGAALV